MDYEEMKKIMHSFFSKNNFITAWLLKMSSAISQLLATVLAMALDMYAMLFCRLKFITKYQILYRNIDFFQYDIYNE